MMSTTLWNELRCFMRVHRWEVVRDGSQKGRQCRDRGERDFEERSGDFDGIDQLGRLGPPSPPGGGGGFG
jgi:hypothetical protein